jgi:hypothetical protein
VLTIYHISQITRGISPQPNDNEEYNKKYTEFTIGSIEQAIREDKDEQFCKLISDQSFNAKNKVNFGPLNEDDSLMEECATYMQLIAFFRAVKCFKQAIMNDPIDLEGISKYAIAGGSNEI